MEWKRRQESSKQRKIDQRRFCKYGKRNPLGTRNLACAQFTALLNHTHAYPTTLKQVGSDRAATYTWLLECVPTYVDDWRFSAPEKVVLRYEKSCWKRGESWSSNASLKSGAASYAVARQRPLAVDKKIPSRIPPNHNHISTSHEPSKHTSSLQRS